LPGSWSPCHCCGVSGPLWPRQPCSSARIESGARSPSLARKVLHCMELSIVDRSKAASGRHFGGLTPGPGQTDCKPFILLPLHGNRPAWQPGADPAALPAAPPTSYMRSHGWPREPASGSRPAPCWRPTHSEGTARAPTPARASPSPGSFQQAEQTLTPEGECV
jgi:hypothetical protein